MKIGNSTIDDNSSAYIVAEMSANHGGNLEKALEIIGSAKKAGANAIKIQTYKAETITLNSSKEDFLLKEGPWKDRKNLFSLYEEAFTPWEWHKDLFQEAKRVGLDIFSSPFDFTAVDLLESLNTPAYKLASPEITDIPLIEYIAQTGKPIILSSGVATIEDLELAFETLHKKNCTDIILLKCTTAYPTPLNEVNLLTLPDMKRRFGCQVGISDHSAGLTVPIASIALGAKFIEKHFIIDRNMETADSFFSLDEAEFSNMVIEVRKVEECLGSVSYHLTPSAQKNIRGRRSLYASQSIKTGDIFTLENIRSVRPSFGLHPKHLKSLIGKKAKRDINFADRILLEDVLD